MNAQKIGKNCLGEVSAEKQKPGWGIRRREKGRGDKPKIFWEKCCVPREGTFPVTWETFSKPTWISCGNQSKRWILPQSWESAGYPAHNRWKGGRASVYIIKMGKLGCEDLSSKSRLCPLLRYRNVERPENCLCVLGRPGPGLRSRAHKATLARG